MKSKIPGQLRELLTRIPASLETDELQNLLEKMCAESDLGNKEPFPLGTCVVVRGYDWPARITAIGIRSYQVHFNGFKTPHQVWFKRNELLIS